MKRRATFANNTPTGPMSVESWQRTTIAPLSECEGTGSGEGYVAVISKTVRQKGHTQEIEDGWSLLFEREPSEI